MILILTDSLGLPRMTPEVLKFHETYPTLLRKRFGYEIYHQGQGFFRVTDIWKKLNYFNPKDFDKIILHFGIVDCAPRPLTKYEYFLLKNIKLNKKVDYILRKYRNVTQTKLVVFEKYCLDIHNYCLDKLLVLPITYSGPSYEEVLPNIGDNVDKYNKVMKKIFKSQLLNLELKEYHFSNDQHHLSKLGHEKISSVLIDNLK